jgi:hypothetical protein
VSGCKATGPQTRPPTRAALFRVVRLELITLERNALVSICKVRKRVLSFLGQFATGRS